MQESNKLYNCQKEYEKVTEVQETKNGEIFQSSEFTEGEFGSAFLKSA